MRSICFLKTLFSSLFHVSWTLLSNLLDPFLDPPMLCLSHFAREACRLPFSSKLLRILSLLLFSVSCRKLGVKHRGSRIPPGVRKQRKVTFSQENGHFCQENVGTYVMSEPFRKRGVTASFPLFSSFALFRVSKGISLAFEHSFSGKRAFSRLF